MRAPLGGTHVRDGAASRKYAITLLMNVLFSTIAQRSKISRELRDTRYTKVDMLTHRSQDEETAAKQANSDFLRNGRNNV